MVAATVETAAQVSHGQLWFRALRAPFLVASVIPVILGGALAWQARGAFDASLFLLTLFGAVCVHLATNMLNDNFDYRSGNDLLVRHQNPFAGGGRVLPLRVLDLTQHLAVSLAFLILGALLGLYLVTQVGLTLLWIGIVGVFIAFFYVVPPFRLAHRGIGELVVGLGFGPLIVNGTYLVQTQRLDLGAFLLSMSMGLLVAAILWVNEFPDVEADTAVGKRTLMSRIGYERSVDWYGYLVGLAYAFVVLGVVTVQVPVTALLVFLTVPIARKALAGLRANYRDPMALIPSNAATVQLTMLFGILAVVGVLIGSLL